MARVLVTVSPRMYREAIALSIHSRRPDLDVRIARPEVSLREIESFQPHLLVRSDSDGLDPQTLAGVAFWVEVSFSDGMDAKVSVDGEVREETDMSMEELLRVVEEAAARAT